MDLSRIFGAGAVIGAVALSGGCATMSDDPCYGATIIPHNGYNHQMAREASGLRSAAHPSYRNYIGGGASYMIFDRLGKPSEAVYQFTTVNNHEVTVRIPNNNSLAGGVGGLFLGAALASNAGSAVKVVAAIGGAKLGDMLIDTPDNAAQASRATACFNKVISGAYDYTVPTTIPPNGKIIPNQTGGTTNYPIQRRGWNLGW